VPASHDFSLNVGRMAVMDGSEEPGTFTFSAHSSPTGELAGAVAEIPRRHPQLHGVGCIESHDRSVVGHSFCACYR
jgi:hypothetical protein